MTKSAQITRSNNQFTHRNSLASIFALLLTFYSTNNFAAYNLEPVYLESVGQYAPLDYYPVAVAIDENNVYSLDLFKEEIQKLDFTGQVVSKFGIIGRWTRDIEVDTAGNTYTVDPNLGMIRKYSPEGNLLLEIGGKGTTPGQFERLLSIVLDENGNIYAADQATELSVFDPEGNLLWNTKDSVHPNGDLLRPQGIDRDSTGNIYVADSNRGQIVIYDANGTYLRSLGPTGNGWPAAPTPVGVAIGDGDTIFVLLRMQKESQIGIDQVLKFSNDGSLLASWGAKGRAPGQLWEPQGITLGPDGNIWIAGYMGHNIVRYDQDGNLISEWNDHDLRPYEFAQVRGAEVGNGGMLYVTDFWNQSVQVFDRFGQYQFMFGERGEGDSTYFNFPRFTATNQNGDIYISDDNHVRRLAADGAFLNRSDRVRYAGGLEVDDLGNVWVTSSEHNYIRKYSPDLQLLQQFNGAGIPSGLNSPYGLAQGPSGQIYVADTLNHRIVRLSAGGSYELEWGSRGSGAGQFSAPVGLATDSQGHVYVSETWNKRIQVFNADGEYLTQWNVPGLPDKKVGRVYELSMEGDYILYAPDHTEGQAEVHKYALTPNVKVSGQPVYVTGQDLGYFLWSDDGSNWHLRWTGDGVAHDFSGTITSTTPFINLNSIGMEAGDYVQASALSRIEFSASEVDGEDGFDFSVGETGVITIYLSVDGTERAELVTVGSDAFTPNTLPLPLKAEYVELQNINTVGRPAYNAGQDAGYFIWQDEDDGEWHLRWSGNGLTTFNFQGAISSTSLMNNVRSFSFESNDSFQVSSPSDLAFNAFAGAGEDGLDFYTAEGAEVTFSLLMNNGADVSFVRIGSAGENPTTMPFSLLTAASDPPSTDIEPPSITITSPSDGGIVSGSIQILADAFDNTAVEKVTFAVDGQWVGRDFTAPYTYNWNTSSHANGAVVIQATAFDLAGNTTRTTISVFVDNGVTDTEVPTITITEPADGATVTGNVQVLAEAFDNTGIQKVTFAIDGQWVGRDFTAPYTFNWRSSTHANGIAVIQATAFDLAGNTNRATISVVVENSDTDIQAPSVTITDPADGATVAGNVQVLAEAFDNTGIQKVTFAIDGQWVGRDFIPPYTYNWNTSSYANGVAELQATAFDLAGNTTTSAVSVTIGN